MFTDTDIQTHVFIYTVCTVYIKTLPLIISLLKNLCTEAAARCHKLSSLHRVCTHILLSANAMTKKVVFILIACQGRRGLT